MKHLPTKNSNNKNYNYYGWDNVRRHLENNGFRIVKIFHNIHEYYNKFQPRLKSSTIIVKKVNNNRKYVEKIPKRYSFVYKKIVNLPHYVINDQIKEDDSHE